MSGLAELGNLWHSIQTWLFPMLEDELGELDEKHREFVAVCETCAPQAHMATYRWVGNGCPPKDRLALCKAFIAKAVWDFPTTRELIDAVRLEMDRFCRRPPRHARPTPPCLPTPVLPPSIANDLRTCESRSRISGEKRLHRHGESIHVPGLAFPDR